MAVLLLFFSILLLGVECIPGTLHLVEGFTGFKALLQIIHNIVNGTNLVCTEESFIRTHDLYISVVL